MRVRIAFVLPVKSRHSAEKRGMILSETDGKI